MQRPIFFIFYFLFFTFFISIQSFAQDEKKNDRDGNNVVGLNVQLPLGEFSETHRFGIGLTYSRSDYRTMRIKKVDVKKIHFTYQAGVAWYNGRREVSYDYDYPSFIFVHVYGGGKYRPGSKTEIKLIAGPALGIYDGHTQFNLGADLIGGYFLNDNFSINPGLGIQLEGGTSAKVVVKLGAQFAF